MQSRFEFAWGYNSPVFTMKTSKFEIQEHLLLMPLFRNILFSQGFIERSQLGPSTTDHPEVPTNHKSSHGAGIFLTGTA